MNRADASWRLVLPVGLAAALVAAVLVWIITPEPQPAGVLTPPPASPEFTDPGAGGCAVLTAKLDRGDRDGLWPVIAGLVDRARNEQVISAARAADQAFEDVIGGGGNAAEIDGALITLETACREAYGSAPR